jgi:predicted kinase
MDQMEEKVRHTNTGQAPTLFLMVGLPGSGKTVRGRELAVERGALQLTADAWALSILGQEDRHQQPGGRRWLLEGRLIALAIDALRLRLSVVLDFGLWSRDERSALRWMAASVGASCEIVYLPVERDVQWRRIQDRWKHTPEQTFPMAEAELDSWTEIFEAPDAEELSGSLLPSPPYGDESWFDWAQRLWPSLAQGLSGGLPAR